MIRRRAFIAGALAAACSRARATETNVTIGVSLLRISQPVFVAAERGLFTARKLGVELRRYDTAQPLADELASGRLDAGGYVAFPILFGGSNAAPHLRVVTAVVEDASHPISYLLARKGSGLHGVASLRGRRVGILPTIAYRKWLEAVLQHEGVAPTDVTIIPMAPALEVEALAGGGVDVLFTGDPMATAALERGVAEMVTTEAVVPRALGDPFVFGTFALAEQFAQKRPDDAAAVRGALDEAIGILTADPGAGRSAMKPWLREAERAFVDRYPDTRYLRSSDLRDEALDRALADTGTSLRARDVVLP